MNNKTKNKKKKHSSNQLVGFTAIRNVGINYELLKRHIYNLF